MKTIRNLLLIVLAAATLGTLADTDGEASATSHSLLDTYAGPQLDHNQIDVYLDNKAAIDAAWEEVGADQPLQAAIDRWMARSAGVQFVNATSAEPAVCTSGSCGPSSVRAVSSRSSRSSPRRFGWRVRRLFGRR